MVVAVNVCVRRMYVEEDGPSTKKLFIHVAEEHAGSYTCTGVLEGNRRSKTVHLDLFSEFIFQLEIWGRAQFEASWCRKSDWKYNLGGRGCSAFKNSRRQPKYSPLENSLGWVNMHTYIFLVNGPKFTNFSPNVGGVVIDYLLFRLPSCMVKVKSCQKSHQLLDVFALQSF